MRRSLKFLHTVSTGTLLGALALQLLVAGRHETALLAGDPALGGAREVVVEAVRWVMVPSLVVCVVTGLLLMGINKTFASAGWVWAKALIGLVLVKGIITIQDPAARGIAALIGDAAGNADALAELARFARMEWLGGWLAVVLAVAAIALGVWRPRFSPRPAPARRPAPVGAESQDAADDPQDVPAR